MAPTRLTLRVYSVPTDLPDDFAAWKKGRKGEVKRGRKENGINERKGGEGRKRPMKIIYIDNSLGIGYRRPSKKDRLAAIYCYMHLSVCSIPLFILSKVKHLYLYSISKGQFPFPLHRSIPSDQPLTDSKVHRRSK